MRVHEAESHALAPVGRHVEAVVPVGVLEPYYVMLAYVEELDDVLDEDMLEDTAPVYPLRIVALDKILLVEILIYRFGALKLVVPEIFGLFQQEIGVPRLLDVKAGSKVRPDTVVHPDAAYPVAVGDELAVFRDDRRVRAVEPHAAETVKYEASRLLRFGQQKGKRVLPDIAPAPAALAVIVVRQKRIAE